MSDHKMTGVHHRTIAPADAEMRLDRWMKREFPGLSHGRLEKLLRTGQIRVDGKRAKAAQRLEAGQDVRLPPLQNETQPAAAQPTRPPPAISDREAKAIQARVLYRDDDVIALDKPPGLAVQGGSKVVKHLDGMLDALRFDAAERPRLVHRLDKDTSGVLLLARTAPAARALTAAFRGKDARKLYWALVVGVPERRHGTIDLPLAKLPGDHGESVVPDEDEGKRAVTDYVVVESLGKRVSWLALAPRTGRTHQLRVHCAAIGCPIVGDGKYGGAEAYLEGGEVSEALHLHARQIRVPHPAGGRRKPIDVAANLPPHMAKSWAFFGFDPHAADAAEAVLLDRDD